MQNRVFAGSSARTSSACQGVARPSVQTPFRLDSLCDRTAEGWIFANPKTGRPYHQEEIQKKHIRTAGVSAGIGEGIGWHTFRHSYRSWLDENGEPMKVQQELMRHASIQTTMNIYGSAMAESKRKAKDRKSVV